ncbi:MAG: hypothetical protein R6X32_06165 [Chloroflexota bacterium]
MPSLIGRFGLMLAYVSGVTELLCLYLAKSRPAGHTINQSCSHANKNGRFQSPRNGRFYNALLYSVGKRPFWGHQFKNLVS